ncbi:MAG: amino acid ABC transporter permease [Actinomycetales bacterium]
MSSVLYDAPGPRARRNTLIGSVIGGGVILALLGYVIYRLNAAGQFAPELWGPLLNPNNEFFRQVWNLLLSGFRLTLEAAALSIVFSVAVGVLLGILRLSLPPAFRWPVVLFIELARGTPVVMAIFFAYVVLPSVGLRWPLLWYLVLALTVYNSVIIAEILRAGVNSLPNGQREAGLAIGLTPVRTLWLIQLPQAFRIMLPALISQAVVALKDTTLAAVTMAGFAEALNQAKPIYQNLGNPIQVYFVVGIIFITINYLLSRLAVWLEGRVSRRTSGDAHALDKAAQIEDA